ncbi:serine/threonine protein kinase [Paenibacillus aestuarii]|uniref:Serine/threonine protein kinase n=1 Tax=Paenibacillus aestuarii TaxID=516965 RepID=A0ABW0KAN2_9BACL|nr:protein kinase [Paenibacillus aestuarii]
MTLLAYWKGAYEAWIDYPQRSGKLLGGRYRIERFLGVGSFGLTYLCCDLHSNDLVVVKQAKPSKKQLGRELLRRESEMMEALKLPEIPASYGLFEADKQLYLVSEYRQGQTVEQLIFERRAVYAEKDALRIIRSLMAIVSAVHEQGIVHLDIRIPNVILRGERISLIDFGLASRIGEPARVETEANEETRRRRTPEVASDLYAVGHFFLFMLYSGYDPDDKEALTGVSWEKELNVSAEVKRMLRKLLQLDLPYTDARDFIHDLDASLQA